jgi:hypothetical protein
VGHGHITYPSDFSKKINIFRSCKVFRQFPLIVVDFWVEIFYSKERSKNHEYRRDYRIADGAHCSEDRQGRLLEEQRLEASVVGGSAFGYRAEAEESEGMQILATTPNCYSERDGESESRSGASEGGCLRGILGYGAS